MHYFLFTHKMGKKNYKNTHMTNDLGVTNDDGIMNIIVRVRKKGGVNETSMM